MHKKIELKSQIIQKKLIPVTNFNIQQPLKNKNQHKMNIKKYMNSTSSQKRIVNARNKNLQVVYKISSNLSQPLNLKGSKFVDSLVISAPKNSKSAVVINKKQRFLMNLQKTQYPQNEKKETNYQKFPTRASKLKNNNPYKYYMFQYSERQGNTIDRFYSQQMRVRTAKESSPSKIELANNTSYVRANFNKNTTSSLKSNARTMTTHEKYLSPWKMQRQENRQQYIFNV